VSFRERFAVARKAAGMTQAEVAERVGLSRSSIANIERGEQEPPLSKAIELARVVGITVDDPAEVHGFDWNPVEILEGLPAYAVVTQPDWRAGASWDQGFLRGDVLDLLYALGPRRVEEVRADVEACDHHVMPSKSIRQNPEFTSPEGVSEVRVPAVGRHHDDPLIETLKEPMPERPADGGVLPSCRCEHRRDER
jgi:putative transcriptional regulator